METRENIERGMPPEEARRAAQRTFGNVGVTRERIREALPIYWMETLWQDVRYGARLIRRSPMLAAAVVATLTFGIGLNTGIFTLINAELFRSGVKDPDSFVRVHPVYTGDVPPGNPRSGRASREDYLDWREATRTIRDLAAWQSTGGLLDDDDTARVPAFEVSCNYFAVYGTRQPALGRLFLEEECGNHGPQTVTVLSEELWRTRYAADPNIVGKMVQFDRRALAVVGVARRGTGEPMRGGLWIPYSTRVSAGLGPLRVEGRLKPGFSRAAAQAELQVLASRQDRLHPGRTTRMHVTGGAGIEEPGAAPRLFWVLSLVLGALAVVLLLVCVNVSLLMLSQASSRHREIAVRLSLGAGRARLLRMLLTQSLLMAGAAGAASAWMAYWFPSAFLALANLRVDYSLAPDWRVFLYLGVIAMGAGCAAGLAPASESLKTDLTSAIKGHPGHLGMTPWKMRDSLVTAQVALSLLLLAAAGLLAKATYGALTGDPGFEADRVLVAYSPLRFPPYTTASAASFYREFAGRVAVLPGVESVAFATSIRSGDSIELVKSHARLSDPGSQASVNQVSPQFFRTMGIRLIRGRTFTSEEASVAAPITVVSETLGWTQRLRQPVNPLFAAR